MLQALPELCGARGVGWVLSHVASPESQKRIRFLGTSATHDHHLVTGPGGAVGDGLSLSFEIPRTLDLHPRRQGAAMGTTTRGKAA